MCIYRYLGYIIKWYYSSIKKTEKSVSVVVNTLCRSKWRVTTVSYVFGHILSWVVKGNTKQQIKHWKSTKLPWNHDIKFSFYFIYFPFLSFCCFVFLFFWSRNHSNQMSERSQVSKVTLRALIESLTTNGRYGAARAAKKQLGGSLSFRLLNW